MKRLRFRSGAIALLVTGFAGCLFAATMTLGGEGDKPAGSSPAGSRTIISSPAEQDGTAKKADQAEASAGLPQAPPATSAPASELQSLGRAASRSGVRQADIKPERYVQLVQAARAYAAAVAGEDNAKFVDLYSTALQRAIAVETGIARELDAAQMAAPILAPMPEAPALIRAAPLPKLSSIWDNRELQKNFRSLLDQASRPASGLFPIAGQPPAGQLRIVGPGTRRAFVGEFTDCVCVGQGDGDDNEFCCTGTLVGKNVVVTAGHCFECASGGANAVVFVGNNINRQGRTYQGKIIRHADYGRDGKHNDLAVIVLSEDVQGVEPRKIATKAETEQAAFVRAVGFGNSNFAGTQGFGIKRLVDIPIASNSCVGAADPGGLGCDHGLELVAGFVGPGPDSCRGDSGGPIYILTGADPSQSQSWSVCGATSRATAQAIRVCGDGGIYVRLDQYLDFIKNAPGARF